MKLRLLALPLLLIPAVVLSAQPRAFYSPTERPGITSDRKKLSGELLSTTGASPPAVTAPPGAPAEKPLPAVAPPAAGRLDGISLSRDGKAHAWISGRRYEDGSSYAGRRLQVSSNGIRLQDSARLIKVGEAIP